MMLSIGTLLTFWQPAALLYSKDVPASADSSFSGSLLILDLIFTLLMFTKDCHSWAFPQDTVPSSPSPCGKMA